MGAKSAREAQCKTETDKETPVLASLAPTFSRKAYLTTEVPSGKRLTKDAILLLLKKNRHRRNINNSKPFSPDRVITLRTAEAVSGRDN